MSGETKDTRENGKYYVVASVIAGIFSVIVAVIEVIGNNKLKKESDLLQIQNSELTEQLNTLQDDNEKILDKFEILEKDYNSLSKDDNLPAISESDKKEITEIKQTLDYYVENHNYYFSHLETDYSEIELIYKLFLSEGYFKHNNVILAFEEYGIDCHELSIHESLLAIWDIEVLYSYKAMNTNAENISEKIYFFNDYKLDEIDDFNYRGFKMNYSNETYELIHKDLEERINNIYKKLKRNHIQVVESP